MLSARRAAWLAARAARRRSDGSLGPLARLAWRRLVRAGDRGHQAAISAVWAAWVRAPIGAAGAEFWEALSRWREPQGLAEDVFEAAADPERAPAQRAAIGDFCRQHGLTPRDAVRRAMFYVLTGQTAQHGAEDPDGRLLAVGYGLSAEPTRHALRSALASAGDLDVVRVVGGHAGQLTAEERGYLSRQLVSRRDWAGLWHLARDLPLTEAVAAMRLLRDGWEPGGESDRALFSQLARADPEAIARSAEELAKPTVIDLETGDLVLRGSFSPDGRRLLVSVCGPGTPYAGVRVYDLPSGSLVERHDNPGRTAPDAVVHLGSSFLVVGHRIEVVWELVRYAGGQRALRRHGGRGQRLPGRSGGSVLAPPPALPGSGRPGQQADSRERGRPVGSCRRRLRRAGGGSPAFGVGAADQHREPDHALAHRPDRPAADR